MIAPQDVDEVPSYASNQETPSDQVNALDLATVDAAREAANRDVSEMRVIATSLQSASSAISNADNQIGLVDPISSFLKTLSLFNSVVDKIATVCCPVRVRPLYAFHT